MKYSKKNLIEDVTKEATMLRHNATDKEKGRLDIEDLDPDNPFRCIYGLATGDCFSRRAVKLITLCCPRYFIASNFDPFDPSLLDVTKNVNGTNAPIKQERINNNNITHFSAIEAYIQIPNANNKNLIQFIKGETETLKL